MIKKKLCNVSLKENLPEFSNICTLYNKERTIIDMILVMHQAMRTCLNWQFVPFRAAAHIDTSFIFGIFLKKI